MSFEFRSAAALGKSACSIILEIYVLKIALVGRYPTAVPEYPPRDWRTVGLYEKGEIR
jgi:hypothetical protein